SSDGCSRLVQCRRAPASMGRVVPFRKIDPLIDDAQSCVLHPGIGPPRSPLDQREREPERGAVLDSLEIGTVVSCGLIGRGGAGLGVSENKAIFVAQIGRIVIVKDSRPPSTHLSLPRTHRRRADSRHGRAADPFTKHADRVQPESYSRALAESLITTAQSAQIHRQRLTVQLTGPRCHCNWWPPMSTKIFPS